jgi:hypothetical protein
MAKLTPKNDDIQPDPTPVPAEETTQLTPLEDCPPPEADIEAPTYEELLEANRVLAANNKQLDSDLQNALRQAPIDPNKFAGSGYNDRYREDVRHHVRLMRGENLAPYCFIHAGVKFPPIRVEWEVDVALWGPYLEVLDNAVETRYKDVPRADGEGIDHVPYRYQRVQYQYFGPVTEEEAAKMNTATLAKAG